MKKLMIFAVAASAILLLAGCGGTKASDSGQSSGNTAATQQTGKSVREIPIGDPKEIDGMRISSVYFEASNLYPPEKAGLKASDADIHLETDIKANKDNNVGFGVGEWIPALTVNYKVKNMDTGKEISGTFMAMNASDGPHYGANVKMPGGAGKYKYSLSIESPEKQNFLLHVDKGSGVEGRFWTKPIEVEWQFPYLPVK